MGMSGTVVVAGARRRPRDGDGHGARGAASASRLTSRRPRSAERRPSALPAGAVVFGGRRARAAWYRRRDVREFRRIARRRRGSSGPSRGGRAAALSDDGRRRGSPPGPVRLDGRHRRRRPPVRADRALRRADGRAGEGGAGVARPGRRAPVGGRLTQVWRVGGETGGVVLVCRYRARPRRSRSASRPDVATCEQTIGWDAKRGVIDDPPRRRPCGARRDGPRPRRSPAPVDRYDGIRY